MKREKEILASFAVKSQTAKVIAAVFDKCSVKMEKASRLSDILRERPHSQNFFYSIIVFF